MATVSKTIPLPSRGWLRIFSGISPARRDSLHPRLGRRDRYLFALQPVLGAEHDGNTAYAMGYTGLGVGASHFGARVLLDLLDGCQTERTALEMVRTKPVPFPPEPLLTIGRRISSRDARTSGCGQ